MIEYIWHISDLHIIPESIENIKSSFKYLISGIQLKGVDKSMLVIVGDIFDTHKKIDMSVYDLFTDLCIELEKNKIKTLIMPGNHDYNTNSDEINDWITLILKKGSYEYIKTYNKSCIIDAEKEFGMVNTEFYIWMPTEKDLPLPQNNNKTKIALIHEPINSAEYDNGNKITGGRFHVDDLKAFDYVMLGDIHKPQFLTPTIAYSGSFVQKHIGEGIEHGCIIWNLEKKKGVHKFFPLKEVYYTAYRDSEGNWILPNLIEDQEITKLRYNENNCTKKDIDDLKQLFKVTYKINKLPKMIPINRTRELIQTFDTNPINVEGLDIAQTTMLLDHNTLLKEILVDLGKEHMVDKIIEYHTKTLKDITDINYAKYKLNYLVWNNAFCYGPEPSYIDFRNIKNDLVIINGKNAQGKSSVIDILSTALFGKPTRGSKSDIINSDAVSMNIKLCFGIDHDEYIVELIIYQKGSANHIGKLLKKTEDGYLDMSLKPITDMHKYISDTLNIGSLEMFINMTAAIQNRKFLVDCSNKNEFKSIDAILSTIININNVNKALEKSKQRKSFLNDKIKSDKNELKLLLGKNYNEETLSQLKREIEEINQKRITLKDKLKKFSDKKYEFTGKKIFIESYKDFDYENINEDINRLENDSSRFLQELKNIMTEEEINKVDQMNIDDISNLSASIEHYKKMLESNSKEKIKEKILEIFGNIKKITPDNNVDVKIINSIIQKGYPKHDMKNIQECKIDKLTEELTLDEISNINVKISKLRLEKYSDYINDVIPLTEPSKPDDYHKYKDYIVLTTQGLPNYSDLNNELLELQKDSEIIIKKINSFSFNDNCNKCNMNKTHIVKLEKLYDDKILDIKSKLSKKEQIIEDYNRALERTKIIEKYDNSIKLYKNKIIDTEIKSLEEKISYNDFIKNQNKIFLLNEENKKFNLALKNDINVYNYALEAKPLLVKLKEIENLEKEHGHKYKIFKYVSNSFDHKKLLEISKKISFNKRIDDKILLAENKISEVERLIDEYEKSIDNKKTEYNLYENCYNRKVEIEEKIKLDEEEFEFLHVYTKCISGDKKKKDLKTLLYTYICDILDKKCNEILSLVADFSLKFSYSDKLDIKVCKDGVERNAAMISGYQKFVVDFILRIVLIKLSPASHPNLLFIDEGFGALDEENFIKVAEVLHNLKSNLDGIIIITHIPELKDYMDKIINIKKVGGYSQIEFGNLDTEEKHFIKSSQITSDAAHISAMRNELNPIITNGDMKITMIKKVPYEIKIISKEDLSQLNKDYYKGTTKKISTENLEKIKQYIEENKYIYNVLFRFVKSENKYVCISDGCDLSSYTEGGLYKHAHVKEDAGKDRQHKNFILRIMNA